LLAYNDVAATSNKLSVRIAGVSDRDRASSSFLQPAQPFSELLQHAMEDRPDPGANHQQCAKSPLRRAFEMGDPEFVCVGGQEDGWSCM
jgi:hypothetical protein